MNNAVLKPKYLDLTEKLGLKLPVCWCLIALVIGLLSQEIGGTLFVSSMTLLVTWLSFKLSCLVFSFQENSGILSNSSFDVLLKFVWFASLFGFIYSIFSAIFFQPPKYTFFYLVFSIAYFGFSLAASKKWGSYYVEARI